MHKNFYEFREWDKIAKLITRENLVCLSNAWWIRIVHWENAKMRNSNAAKFLHNSRKIQRKWHVLQ